MKESRLSKLMMLSMIMANTATGFVNRPIHLKDFGNALGRKAIDLYTINSNIMQIFGSTSNEEDNSKLTETNMDDDSLSSSSSRRNFVAAGLAGALSVSMNNQFIAPANAAVGTLPELKETNAILQGVTVNVADISQQNAMIKFLEDGFDMLVLRKRIIGSIEETWMGFGPEELNIPEDFEMAVSSFSSYGGHASICIRYDSSSGAPLYRSGNDSPAPGNNIAYLQLGVPQYRISQMVKNSGNILDAYGIVNVVSPAGLPIRGIVGISPDPMMFVAINCEDVQASAQFYQSLGFTPQEYPYARPNKGAGQFEPPQPRKSVYLSLSENCMGVLLLPVKGSGGGIFGGGGNKKVVVNPVVDSLRIVYKPSEENVGEESSQAVLSFVDPSGVPLSFQSVTQFEKEERMTR